MAERLVAVLTTVLTAAAAACAAPPLHPPMRGVGIWRYADGRTFTGRFEEGSPSFGVLTYPNAQGGGTYSGEFDDSARRSGSGEMAWNELGGIPGARYRGAWEADHPHGAGVMELGLGDTYAGRFLNGAMHGTASLAYASGERYEGAVHGGLPDGLGVHTWPPRRAAATSRAIAASAQYVGAFSRGRQSGLGIHTTANGTTAVGEFVAGELEGKGLLTRATGSAHRSERTWSVRWDAGASRAQATAPGGDFVGNAALASSAAERDALLRAAAVTAVAARAAAAAARALLPRAMEAAASGRAAAAAARLEAKRALEATSRYSEGEGECVGVASSAR